MCSNFKSEEIVCGEKTLALEGEFGLVDQLLSGVVAILVVVHVALVRRCLCCDRGAFATRSQGPVALAKVVEY